MEAQPYKSSRDTTEQLEARAAAMRETHSQMNSAEPVAESNDETTGQGNSEDTQNEVEVREFKMAPDTTESGHPEDNHDYKKRHADATRALHKNIAEKKELEAELEQMRAALDAAKSEQSSGLSGEETTVLADTSIARIEELEKSLQEVNSKLSVVTEEREKARLEASEARLRSQHPDYDSLKTDKEFHRWLQSQSQLTQDTIYNSRNVDDAINTIKLYKYETGKVKVVGTNSDTLDAARAVSRSSGIPSEATPKNLPSFTKEQLSRMSVEEYQKNREAIQEAHRQGRIR